MKVIDCRGLACPKPVILTKKELEISNDNIEVIVDNEAARENVSKYIKNNGYNYEIKEKDGLYHIVISTGDISVEPQECEIMELGKKSITILISSNLLGTGDERLGAALMKSYLYALSESSDKPRYMLLVNSGVKLTVEGSEVIETLKALEQSGVEILSCGTCLDFYGLKDKLVIGSITNMYNIVEKMNESTNTIKL